MMREVKDDEVVIPFRRYLELSIIEQKFESIARDVNRPYMDIVDMMCLERERLFKKEEVEDDTV